MSASGKPIHPLLVLGAAIILPGSGHLLLGLVQRGLGFLFFMAILGWISIRLMPADASFFARHSGAILIYGFCALDAYRIAKIRYEQWRHGERAGTTDG